MHSTFLHFSTFIPRKKDDIVLVFGTNLGLDNSSRFVLYEGKELFVTYLANTEEFLLHFRRTYKIPDRTIGM